MLVSKEADGIEILFAARAYTRAPKFIIPWTMR